MTRHVVGGSDIVEMHVRATKEMRVGHIVDNKILDCDASIADDAPTAVPSVINCIGCLSEELCRGLGRRNVETLGAMLEHRVLILSGHGAIEIDIVTQKVDDGRLFGEQRSVGATDNVQYTRSRKLKHVK